MTSGGHEIPTIHCSTKEQIPDRIFALAILKQDPKRKAPFAIICHANIVDDPHPHESWISACDCGALRR